MLSSISSLIKKHIWKELCLAITIGIIVNESTDITIESYLIIYVRYFINSIIKIKFLNLLQIEANDTKFIYNTIINLFITKSKFINLILIFF